MHTIIHILGRAQGKSRRVNAYRASLLCVRRPRPHTENGPRDTRETRWRGAWTGVRGSSPPVAGGVVPFVPFRLPFRSRRSQTPVPRHRGEQRHNRVYAKGNPYFHDLHTGCINTTTQDRSVDERARYSSPGAASGEARRNWANWVRQHGAPARAGTRAPR